MEESRDIEGATDTLVSSPFSGTGAGTNAPVKNDELPPPFRKKLPLVAAYAPSNPTRTAAAVPYAEEKSADPRMVPPKCPFGYDSNTFKLGPLSCMICQALLHESSKCTPCSHKFCKACVSRFKDCPLCGDDIEGIEPDAELYALVDRFIDGHARIKRSHAAGDGKVADGKNKVIYEREVLFWCSKL